MTSRTLPPPLSRPASCLLFALAFAIPSLDGSPALAQADASAPHATEARALFQQGVALADQNRWAEAADRFEKALALRDSPVIAYNLGSALRELRRWVEACTYFHRAAQAPNASPALRRSATEALGTLSPRLGRLTVRVPGHRAGDRVLLDDQPLAAEQLGATMSIDPGSHALSVERDARTIHSESVIVFEGAARELSLILPPDPREAALAAPALTERHAAATRPTPRAEESGAPWWVWAGAGTLVAGAITVAAVLIASDDGDSKLAPGTFDPPAVFVGGARGNGR